MKQLSLVLSILALILVGVLFYLQTGNKKEIKSVSGVKDSNSVAPAGDFRIAYFEMDSLENNYQYVKDAFSQLKAREDALNSELSGLERTYQKKVAGWQEKGSSMSQSEAEAAQREYAQMQQNFQARKQTLEQELIDLKNTKMRDIQKNVEDYLKEYNKDKNYAFIFSYEPALFIYYKDSAYDITSDLIRGLNEKYKAKGKK